MEDIIKIQESFDELTKEVEKFRTMSELAQSHHLAISEMSKQLTKVISNFEKYRNILDGRIDIQSNSIESLLVELRNTQQSLGKTLEKFDVTLGRNLKSIIDTSEQQINKSTKNIITTFTNVNDQTVSELISIQGSLDEFRSHLTQFIDNQSKKHENIILLFEINNKRQNNIYRFMWSLIFILIASFGIIIYVLITK